MKWKKMLGGIKKHGVAGAVSKQLGQWSEAVVDQAEKMEGGVEKHGLEGAVVRQLDVWTSSSSEEQSKREAEERVREELRRKAEAEERDLREREELRRKAEAEERVREELRRKAEAEERELHEREEQQKKLAAEKPLPKKVPFKDFMHKFLERDPKLDDEKAFAAMRMVAVEGVDNSVLAQQLLSLQDPMINQHVIEWFTTTDIIGDSEVFDL